jgi:hypothetical protein
MYIRNKNREQGKGCTHCDAINFRVIHFVVIPIDRVLADNESGADGERKLRGIRLGGENFVDVIHGQDDCRKVWRSTREK